MLGDLAKRLVNGVVLLLGSLAFFLVPVGGKTTAQHTVAIFTTKPAKEAARAFQKAAKQLTSEILKEVEKTKKSAAPVDSKQAENKPAG